MSETQEMKNRRTLIWETLRQVTLDEINQKRKCLLLATVKGEAELSGWKIASITSKRDFVLHF